MTNFTLYISAGTSQRVLTTYEQETANWTRPFENINGYVSMGVVYSFFTVANLVAPIFIDILTAKWSMFIASLSYAAYYASFILPDTVVIYCTSALLGIGAGIL